MSLDEEELESVDIGGNVYAVLALEDRRIVVNAGLNKLHQVDDDDAVTDVVTLFPRHSAEDGPFLFGIPDLDSVPTTIALGPDGAFYVGELTGFPFVPGQSRIYRIPQDHVASDDPPVYLDGFSHIIDIAFDEDGTLYVLEMATVTLRNVFGGTEFSTGDLVRVDADGSRERLVLGLHTPAGIALDPDGESIYISNCGVCVGSGEVLRLDLDDDGVDDSSDD